MQHRTVSGLRSLGVAFPAHDWFKPGGGRRIFKDGKIQGTSPLGGTLSCLTRVVDLLHVKEPQTPRVPLSKIIGHFPSKQSFQTPPADGAAWYHLP
jgi:hypothetical protein